VSLTGGEHGHVAGDYAYRKLGWRKVAVIAMDYGWGHEVTGGFQRVFEELGGQVIQKIWTPVNTTDFGPYVASLKPEADGILDVVTGAASIRLIGETNPSLLLLDEPTEGLSPLYIETVGHVIRTLQQSGMSMLLVEQRLRFALLHSDFVHIMSRGKIVHSSSPQELGRDADVRARYLGV